MDDKTFDFFKTNRYTCMRMRYSQKQTEEIYMTLCGVEHCVANQTFGPIVREEYHLHAILSGKGTVEVDGKTQQIHRKQLFLVKPGEMTSYQADEEDPWCYCWLSFAGTNAKYYMDAAGFTNGVNVRNCYVDPQEFLILIQRLLEYTEVNVACDLRRLGISLEYLALAVESNTMNEHAIHHHAYSPDVYVRHALDFIRMNYETAKVNDIAKYIGINRSYLTNIFKKKMGISPQEYLLQYRLNMGRQLLLTTDLSIQDVAQKIGYENPLTFSKMFKNAYGVSPRNYRLRERETDGEGNLLPAALEEPAADAEDEAAETET